MLDCGGKGNVKVGVEPANMCEEEEEGGTGVTNILDWGGRGSAIVMTTGGLVAIM